MASVTGPISVSAHGRNLSSSSGRAKRHYAEAFPVDDENIDSTPRRKRKSDAGKPYTVQMQTVHIRKKKETYLDAFSVEAPKGYFYLPIGFRKLKEQCRAICLESSIQYYVVNIYPRNSKNQLKRKITGNIYRFGWHFPSDIILKAMASMGLDSVENVHSSRNMLAEAANMSSPYCTDENLKELCLDLFPKIPEEDLYNIIAHAFERGSDRVGNAEIPFPRRMQLAVLAHIRHVHTDYEALLKQHRRRGLARMQIEPKCLRILIKWRGEDDEVDFEERDEEVIVIDDSDDESEDELDTYNNTSRQDHGRGSPDLEILAWKQNGRNVQVYAQDLPSAFYQPSFGQLIDPLSSHAAMYSHQRSGHHVLKHEPITPERYQIANRPLPPPPHGYTYASSSAMIIGNNYTDPIVIGDSPYRRSKGYMQAQMRSNIPYSDIPKSPQRPPQNYSSSATANKPRTVYDKYGRPYHLIDGKTVPLQDSPDAALPSIESDRDSRPASRQAPPPTQIPRHVAPPQNYQPPTLHSYPYAPPPPPLPLNSHFTSASVHPPTHTPRYDPHVHGARPIYQQPPPAMSMINNHHQPGSQHQESDKPPMRQWSGSSHHDFEAMNENKPWHGFVDSR